MADNYGSKLLREVVTDFDNEALEFRMEWRFDHVSPLTRAMNCRLCGER